MSAKADQLLRRLGGHASVDDPLFGHASGAPELERQLHEASHWLIARGATFEIFAFTTGSDRDVTEGTLTLTVDGERLSLPVAVVAERRPERRVDLRLYYAAHALPATPGSPPGRATLVPRDDALSVPPPVAAHLLALTRGDLAALVASFEHGASLRDSAGKTFVKDDGAGGALRAYYEKVLVSRGRLRPSAEPPRVPPAVGIDLAKGARADDGRTCALEFTVTSAHGEGVAPQPGLAVYVRGESGLLRALRLYQDW
ncbi:MAG: hypothetical protein JOZ69_24410 [Myxococcales bacterium]|nr:hypothetical protein [Myxococcales bacterium]